MSQQEKLPLIMHVYNTLNKVGLNHTDFQSMSL
jgi:hypothetical protein